MTRLAPARKHLKFSSQGEKSRVAKMYKFLVKMNLNLPNPCHCKENVILIPRLETPEKLSPAPAPPRLFPPLAVSGEKRWALVALAVHALVLSLDDWSEGDCSSSIKPMGQRSVTTMQGGRDMEKPFPSPSEHLPRGRGFKPCHQDFLDKKLIAHVKGRSHGHNTIQKHLLGVVSFHPALPSSS